MNSHIFSTYSGWKKSCTGWYVTVYPIIIGFQTFGGAGIRNHPQYFWTTTLFGRCFFSQKINYLNDPNEIQLLGSCPDQLVTTNLANGDSNGWPLMTLWTLRALHTRSMASFCPLKTSFKGTSKTHGGPAASWGLTQQKKQAAPLLVARSRYWQHRARRLWVSGMTWHVGRKGLQPIPGSSAVLLGKLTKMPWESTGGAPLLSYPPFQCNWPVGSNLVQPLFGDFCWKELLTRLLTRHLSIHSSTLLSHVIG